MALSDVQRNILASVVKRFLASWEPTGRKALVRQFQDPQSVDELSRWGLIKTVDPMNDPDYVPGSLAFHYCGDAEAEALAKRSVQVMARVFKKQYLDDVRNLSVGDLQAEVQNADREIDPTTAVRLGLYLSRDFGLLQGWTGGTRQQPEITPMNIAEHVVTIKNTETLWDEYVAQNIPWPMPEYEYTRSIIPIGDEESHLAGDFSKDATVTNSRKVFVVHGHDQAAKEAVARFLERLELEAVILHEQANRGRTIIEKFEAHSEEVAFAVVLLTPDDLGAATEPDGNGQSDMKKRARQNVVFELGYFIGKLTRRRVCALYVDGVELPSDMKGVLYIPYDHTGAWRMALAKEIKAAGIEVDLNLMP